MNPRKNNHTKTVWKIVPNPESQTLVCEFCKGVVTYAVCNLQDLKWNRRWTVWACTDHLAKAVEQADELPAKPTPRQIFDDAIRRIEKIANL